MRYNVLLVIAVLVIGLFVIVLNPGYTARFATLWPLLIILGLGLLILAFTYGKKGSRLKFRLILLPAVLVLLIGISCYQNILCMNLGGHWDETTTPYAFTAQTCSAYQDFGTEKWLSAQPIRQYLSR
ncbi:MAG: hypothetical protein JWN90_36 [Parcubacteria group bacterium]|nr:hypothetical protein [Parcubacteria group bacterium]